MSKAVIPHLVVSDGHAAIEFYKAALGAELVAPVMAEPGGGPRVLHAALSVDGAQFYLNDDFPEWCGGASRSPKATGAPQAVTMHLTVADCDAAVAKMAAAGATVTMPACDMFWGDRYAKVQDPFGHEWSFTHPLTADQTAAAARAWEQEMAATTAAV